MNYLSVKELDIKESNHIGMSNSDGRCNSGYVEVLKYIDIFNYESIYWSILQYIYIYIYIYICRYVCVIRQHSLVQTNLVKWYRHMLSIQFYQDLQQYQDAYAEGLGMYIYIYICICMYVCMYKQDVTKDEFLSAV